LSKFSVIITSSKGGGLDATELGGPISDISKGVDDVGDAALDELGLIESE